MFKQTTKVALLIATSYACQDLPSTSEAPLERNEALGDSGFSVGGGGPAQEMVPPTQPPPPAPAARPEPAVAQALSTASMPTSAPPPPSSETPAPTAGVMESVQEEPVTAQTSIADLTVPDVFFDDPDVAPSYAWCRGWSYPNFTWKEGDPRPRTATPRSPALMFRQKSPASDIEAFTKGRYFNADEDYRIELWSLKDDPYANIDIHCRVTGTPTVVAEDMVSGTSDASGEFPYSQGRVRVL